MISFHTIGSAGDAANYHDKSFTQDGMGRADNYYLNEQAAAHWEGLGAEVLGLAGKAVTREDFIDALEGRVRNPANGEMQDLAENSKGESRRAGMDLTIAPSKSVSIVALVGQDERVVQAHLAANSRAMAWLEQNAAVVRVRFDGEVTFKQASNLLYATVMHETDRTNGPQLHNHNVVAAVVYDAESGKWRSLTNDTLLVLRAQADVVYKSELAKGLRAAGYELDYAANSVDFEIKGFQAGHVEAYSLRTQQIRDALVARGIDPANASFDARQTAALDSRSRKIEVPREALQQVWQETARQAGLDIGSIVATARDRAVTLEARTPEQTQQASLIAVTWGIEHLSEREQSFKRTDLEIAALKFDRSLQIDAVAWALERHVQNGQLIDRGADDTASRLVTTPKALAAERALVADIEHGKNRNDVVLAERAEFTAAVTAFEAKKSIETGTPFKLSDEQLNAARNVLMHADAYQGIQGEAGTGKTAALAMVKDAAESRGWQVMGMATSASAANELQASSGIPSQTVAGFFVERDNAMRLTQKRIASLEASLGKRSEPGSSIERQKLRVETGDVNFSEGHYTFDHQRGEVFKARGAFAGMVGAFLLDAADSGREAADRKRTRDTSFGGRFASDMLLLGAGAADALGQRISGFEPVGHVEAALARSTLYLQREAQTNPMERDLALSRAELANLTHTGNRQGRKTLLVMDEASLTGALDAAKVSSLAGSIDARVVFQGDTKQHGSVPAGRAFGQAQQAGMHTSILQETRRFDKATPQVKNALMEIRAGRYAAAVALLDTSVVANDKLAEKTAERYLANLQELRARGVAEPKVGVVALTNADRKAINAAVHALFVSNGLVAKEGFDKTHLDDPKLTPAERANVGMLRNAGVDHVVFRQNYRELGVRKDDVLKVVQFDVDNNRLILEKQGGARVTVNPMKQERFAPARLEVRQFSEGDLIETRANIRFADKSIERIANGTRGKVVAIDVDGAAIEWTGGRQTRLSNDQLRLVDHSYARTSYKEQGATNDREIIAVSVTGANVINRQATYVSVSRARENTEIVTSSLARLLKNAGRDVSKSTAIEMQPSQQLAVGAAGPTIHQLLAARRAQTSDRDLGSAQALPFTESLIRALRSSQRQTALGMQPHPVAQDVLRSRSLNQLGQEMAMLGLVQVRPFSGGGSSVVLDAGDRVVRIGLGEQIDRPRIPELLQAQAAGAVGGLRYEILPKVDTRGITQSDVTHMTLQLADRGYRWGDDAPDNLGRHEGRLVVIDPGGVTPIERTRAAAPDLKRGEATPQLADLGSGTKPVQPETIYQLVAANRFEAEKRPTLPALDEQREIATSRDKGRGRGITR